MLSWTRILHQHLFWQTAYPACAPNIDLGVVITADDKGAWMPLQCFPLPICLLWVHTCTGFSWEVRGVKKNMFLSAAGVFFFFRVLQYLAFRSEPLSYLVKCWRVKWLLWTLSAEQPENSSLRISRLTEVSSIKTIVCSTCTLQQS